MKTIFNNKYINLLATLESVAGILAFIFAMLGYDSASSALLGIFVIGMLASLTIWYGFIGNSFMGRKGNAKKSKSDLYLVPNLIVNVVTLILMLISYFA